MHKGTAAENGMCKYKVKITLLQSLPAAMHLLKVKKNVVILPEALGDGMLLS